MNAIDRTIELLARLRERAPLVHCMTNSVAANFTANALLSLGASPAMIPDAVEAPLFARSADALLVNLGTVTAADAAVMKDAVDAARGNRKPWVLDPVAVGALPLRTDLARYLARRFPSVIRGNASEIIALAGGAPSSRGVDSSAPAGDAEEPARSLSCATDSVVMATGETDFIASPAGDELHVFNGTPMLSRVTGAGCAQGAVCAAFCAVAEGDAFAAAAASAFVVAIAGEKAARAAAGPGSFAAAYLDALCSLSGDDVKAYARAGE